MGGYTSISRMVEIDRKKSFVVGFLCENCKRKQLGKGMNQISQTSYVYTKRGEDKAYDKSTEALKGNMQKISEGLKSGSMSSAHLYCSCRYCGNRPQWANYSNPEKLYKACGMAYNALGVAALVLLVVHMMNKGKAALYGAISLIVCGILALIVPRILIMQKNKKQDKLVQQMNHAYWPVLLEDEASQRAYLRGESDEVLAEYGFVPEKAADGSI